MLSFLGPGHQVQVCGGVGQKAAAALIKSLSVRLVGELARVRHLVLLLPVGRLLGCDRYHQGSPLLKPPCNALELFLRDFVNARAVPREVHECK